MAWFRKRRSEPEQVADRTDGPLPARTRAEEDAYMAVHPCDCGHAMVPWTISGSVDKQFRVTKTYAGACPSCGAPWRFTFRTAEPRDGDGMFGAGVSELLDPGEWLAYARTTMNSAGNPQRTVETAIAAIEEAFKFIPPGKRAVPRSALRSQHSRDMLAADPATFEFETMIRLFRNGFGGTAAPPMASRPIALRPDPLRLRVPGRCPDGSFSPDGSQLAVASGFQRVNGTPDGEIAVFATDDERCLQRHTFEAYSVRVVHTGDGVVVADWQLRDGKLAVGRLARHTPGGVDVLVEDIGINPLVHTPDGFAALTHQGDLVLGAGDDVGMLPPPGPVACLASDPVSGRLAAGGDRLVVMDADGRPLAAAAVPATLLEVAFLGPDRLITAAPGALTLWQVDGADLTVRASTSAVPYLADLVVLPRHGLVVGIDRELWTTVVQVGDSSLDVVATPEGLHGRDVWADPSGDVVALPYRIDRSLPPAPEQVEVHDTRAW
jgi:hypothetical protein